MTEYSNEERLWATATHLSAFAGFLFPFFGNVLAPLIVWLVKKDESSFIDNQGKEALNFQITISIGLMIAGVLAFVLIGIPILWAIGIYNIVMVIIAAIKTHEGEHYRYPYSLRLIS